VARQRRLHRVRDIVQPVQRCTQSDGELRQPHQGAEVARGEGRTALLLDRLDVDARRAPAPDHDDGHVTGTALAFQHLGREALRVPVAHHQDRVGLTERQVVLSRVHRLDGHGLDAGLAEQPDRVVRRVPARPGADDNEATAPEPFGLRLDRRDVRKQCFQVVRLAPDRGAHHTRHFADSAATESSPPERALRVSRRNGSRDQSPGQGISLPPVIPFGRRTSVRTRTTARTKFAVPDGGLTSPSPLTSQRRKVS
jgi:hypothetical protein